MSLWKSWCRPTEKPRLRTRECHCPTSFQDAEIESCYPLADVVVEEDATRASPNDMSSTKTKIRNSKIWRPTRLETALLSYRNLASRGIPYGTTGKSGLQLVPGSSSLRSHNRPTHKIGRNCYETPPSRCISQGKSHRRQSESLASQRLHFQITRIPCLEHGQQRVLSAPQIISPQKYAEVYPASH